MFHSSFLFSGDVVALKVSYAMESNIARGSRELEVHRITDQACVLNGEL